MFSLSLAEAAGRGIALITGAYLSRTILVDGVGILGFVSAIGAYYVSIIVLGFNVIGIREIAKDTSHIPKYVNSIVTIRLIIAVLSFFTLAAIVFLIDKPPMVKNILLISGFNFFSQAILLDWVYQAIEKMEIQALRQVITGLINLLGIIIFVHSPSHVMIAMIVTVTATALNSLWMLVYYVKLYGKIKFVYDKDLWKSMMKASLSIGLSSLIIVNYNYLNTILLGFFRGDHDTGLYTNAYKILVVTILPSAVIQNAFFPVLSRAEDKEHRARIMKKYSDLLYILAALISGLIFTYSDYFIVLLFGKAFAPAAAILRVLMITSVLMYVNVSFTAPLMAWKLEKKVLLAISIGGAASAILNFAVIPSWGYMGAAFVTIMSELVVFTGLTLINFKLTGKLFFPSIAKFLVYSSLSCSAGYFLMSKGLGAVFAVLFSAFSYLGFILLFKNVTISEIKGYLINEV